MTNHEQINHSVFHRNAVQYIIGRNKDLESKGDDKFDVLLDKLAKQHNFNWKNMSRDDLENKTADFMKKLTCSELEQVLKFFGVKQFDAD